METSLGGGGPLAHPSQPAVGRFPAGRSAADAAGQCEGAAGEMDSLERRHSAVGGSTGPDCPAAAAPGAEPAAALELAAPAATTPVTLPPLGRSESSTVCLRSPSGAPYLSAGKPSNTKQPVPVASAAASSEGLGRGTQSPPQAKPARDKSLPKFSDSFAWTAQRDLPTAYRSIEEDNKVLNSELKQLRARAHEQDVGAAAAERQLCALRAEVARLQQAVRECAVAPAALLADQECRAQLAQRDRAVRQAEERAALLEKARESAERRFRADLAAERRQQEALRGEAARLKEALADKGRQARMMQLHVKGLYQRLAALEAAVKGVPALPALQAPLTPPPPPPEAEPEERVSLMLCLVYDKAPPTAAEQAESIRLAAVEAAYLELLQQRRHAAAQAIQARFRGFAARKQFQQQRQAAMKIQASVRNMLARRHSAATEESTAEGEKAPAERLKVRRLQAEKRHAQRGLRRKGFMAVAHGEEAPRPSKPANTAPEAARHARLSKAGAAEPARATPTPIQPPAGRRPSNAAGALGAAGGAAPVPKLTLTKSWKTGAPPTGPLG